ncbi:nitroreductase [Pseudomonas cyclaminis]|uniref:nitroreductase n=1 Tax=Pseudomonas cyclaminis TaxID=2781239 RepID=UPI00380AA5A0
MTMSEHQTAVRDSASVVSAIESRFSCRAFSPEKCVAPEQVHEILRIASNAASSTNTQPWKVYVLQGDRRYALVEKVCAAHDSTRGDPSRAAEYGDVDGYYPAEWVSPYIDRRRQNGWGLYGALGIVKGEKDKMHAQTQRNYRFFDAPVGLMFTIDRVMGYGSLIDYGMFLQTIMLAARSFGMHTCPQAAWNNYAKIVMPFIGAESNEMLVCGMALGYADESAQVNTYQPPREAVDSFTRWV